MVTKILQISIVMIFGGMNAAYGYVIGFEEREFCGGWARYLSSPVIDGEYIARASYPGHYSLRNPGPCSAHVLLPDNGTTHVSLASGSYMAISRIDAGAFNLVSIDYAEYSELVLYVDSFDVVGVKNDGTVLTETIYLDKVLDGLNGEDDFQTHYFSHDWQNLSRVEFVSSLVAVDNIDVSTGPLPIGVSIDLKPHNKGNRIDIRESAVKVAVLSINTDDGDKFDFDSSQVDPDSILLNGTLTHTIQNVKAKDVDNDGDTDLVILMKSANGFVSCGQSVFGLTGETFAGDQIVGEDHVTAVGCK